MGNRQIRVATTSAPHRVAGSIAKTLRERGSAQVQAIGAGAVNQMMKSVILAQSYVEAEGGRICCVPSFAQVEIGTRRGSAVHLFVHMGQPDACLCAEACAQK